MKYLFILSLLFIENITIAQFTINGKIFDYENNSIKFVSVILKNDNNTNISTISDSLGTFNFNILNRGKYNLSFNHINYLKYSLDFDLKKDTQILIKLNSDTINLKRVIVKSYQSFIQRKSDRLIVYPNSLNQHEFNALDIISKAPMIVLSENNAIISINNKSNTSIYINNRKTELPKESIIEMLKSLPAENIKNIEIITNPGSEYEAKENGGIINFNIKRLPNEGWKGNISVNTQQGIFNTSIMNGSLNYSKNKLSFQFIPIINKSFNYWDNYYSLTFQNLLKQDINTTMLRNYIVLGSGLNIDYDIDKNNTISYSGWISRVVGNAEFTSLSKYSMNNLPNLDSLNLSPYKNNDHYLYNFGNLNYHKSLNKQDNKYFNFSFDYNQIKQENYTTGSFYTSNLNQGIETETARYINIMPQNFFNISEKIEYSYSVKQNYSFKTGVQNSNTFVANNFIYNKYNFNSKAYDFSLVNSNYKEKYSAFYFTFNSNLNKHLSGSFGFRIEKTNYLTTTNLSALSDSSISIDTSYLNIFPNLFLNYNLSNNNQFSLSFTKKISRPSFDILFPSINYNSSNYYSQNNPLLQPIIYNNCEAMYSIKNKYFFILNYSILHNSYANFTIPEIKNDISIFKNTILNYGTQQSISFTINTRHSFIKDIWNAQMILSFEHSIYNVLIPQYSSLLNNFHYNLLFDNTINISNKKNIYGFITLTYNSKFANVSQNQINSNSKLDVGFKKIFKNDISVLFFVNDILDDYSNTQSFLTPNMLLKTIYLNQNKYTRSFTLSFRFKFGNIKLKQFDARIIANEEVKSRTGN